MSDSGKQFGGTVKKGHEEAMKLTTSLLQQYELPLGLLPLADVVEAGFVQDTGYMWIAQWERVEHEFKMIGKLVRYDVEISCFVEKKRIRKLRGMKSKEFIVWPPVGEIAVEDPPTGKITFKSLAGTAKAFPVEAFAARRHHED